MTRFTYMFTRRCLCGICQQSHRATIVIFFSLIKKKKNVFTAAQKY
jgi:hypothetical protein